MIPKSTDYFSTIHHEYTDSSPEFKTSITAQQLELVAGAILQIARHIRGDSKGVNRFYNEWDSGKGWYFDESDVQKNLGLSYEFLKILMREYLAETEKEIPKNMEFVVHEHMFEYRKKKTPKKRR